jgi:septation ring formation regulator EzrA
MSVVDVYHRNSVEIQRVLIEDLRGSLEDWATDLAEYELKSPDADAVAVLKKYRKRLDSIRDKLAKVSKKLESNAENYAVYRSLAVEVRRHLELLERKQEAVDKLSEHALEAAKKGGKAVKLGGL